jgi:hypothetical protein
MSTAELMQLWPYNDTLQWNKWLRTQRIRAQMKPFWGRHIWIWSICTYRGCSWSQESMALIIYLCIYWLVLGFISGLLSSKASILSLEPHLLCWLQPHYKEDLSVAFLRVGITQTRIQWTGLLTAIFLDPTIYLLKTLVYSFFQQSPCSLKLTYFLGKVCASDLMHSIYKLQAISCPSWPYSS